MIIMGIDPGISTLGIALSDTRDPKRIKVKCITTAPRSDIKGNWDLDLTERTNRIIKCIRSIVDPCLVSFVIHEHVPRLRNSAIRAKIAYAMGAIHGLFDQSKIMHASPRDIKLAVTGNPKAGKDDMIKAIKERYPSLKWPSRKVLYEHCADAMGAIVYLLNSQIGNGE